MSDFNPKDYWDNRLSHEYSLKGVGDIGLPVSYNNFLYRVRQNAFDYMINKIGLNYSDESFCVLDVGSGTGFYIDQWQRVGAKTIVGSDITDTAVSNLKGKYSNQEFINQDIGNVLTNQLNQRKFDVVTAFDMLFHIVDDNNFETAITNFSALVKPDGYLIFSDNLSPSQDIRLEHQVSRSEKEVFRLLSSKGFKLEKIVPMFVFMNDPVRSKSRVLKKIFSIIYRLASKSEFMGKMVGSLLYIFEVLAIRIMQRGPSTEIFVWKRVE